MKISLRARFTLRALFVFITLGCFLLAGWEGTKRHTAEIRNSRYIDTYALAPFVFDQFYPREGKRRFFVWFFGLTLRLPYEEETPIFEGNPGYP
jgi:hypothetical protein